MCGIVGYLGTQAATDILVSGLERLEYRGYDSAGIATIWQEKLHSVRAKGKLYRLREKWKGTVPPPPLALVTPAGQPMGNQRNIMLTPIWTWRNGWPWFKMALWKITGSCGKNSRAKAILSCRKQTRKSSPSDCGSAPNDEI